MEVVVLCPTGARAVVPDPGGLTERRGSSPEQQHQVVLRGKRSKCWGRREHKIIRIIKYILKAWVPPPLKGIIIMIIVCVKIK